MQVDFKLAVFATATRRSRSQIDLSKVMAKRQGK